MAQIAGYGKTQGFRASILQCKCVGKLVYTSHVTLCEFIIKVTINTYHDEAIGQNIFKSISKISCKVFKNIPLA